MQMLSATEVLEHLDYLVGDAALAADLPNVAARLTFDDRILSFLNDISQTLLHSENAKAYSDVISFAFWIRRASLLRLRERFRPAEDRLMLGRGVAFHIAPSNVPVNFAYSLAAGLLTGNANIVRVPTKDYPQIRILSDAFQQALERHEDIRPYLILVRYARDHTVNDLLSSMADIRIVWGGEQTIAELRTSPLPPRSLEICFADRFSLAVIESEAYLAAENKRKIAEDFFNDTFLFDQNACTSPRFILWTGGRIREAKELFWAEEHRLVQEKYTLQPIQSVDKFALCCRIAASHPGVSVVRQPDNLIVRTALEKLSADLTDQTGSSGFFYEYDCADIRELSVLCAQKRCQTIAYLGDPEKLLPPVLSGGRGVDRIVPLGHTMDFDLLWDGYNLVSMMARTVSII